MVRTLQAPPDGLLPDARWIIAPPGTSPEEEGRLLAETRTTHLVARNSGGDAGWAKIAAAAQTGLPVIMVARPEPDAAGGTDHTGGAGLAGWTADRAR